jgi:cyclophilin family peptidyl-prolyl cis-trans isomerase
MIKHSAIKHPARPYPLLVVPPPERPRKPSRRRATTRRQASSQRRPASRRQRRVGSPRAKLENRLLRFEDLDARVMLDASGVAHHIVTFSTSLGSFQVELSDNATPLTVANFLNYVSGGNYTNTFIHRVATDDSMTTGNPFAVQGGGFRYDGTPLTPAQFGTLQHITTGPPVVNEFDPSRQNLRGTIAMAKTSDPNSATSEWFVNTSDNAFLDNTSNSGGFTVFGHVLGDGMQVVDAIAAVQRYSLGGAFATIPLRNITADTTAASDQNLVIVNSITAFTGSVHGALYADQNNNGQRDAGEGGLSNLTVFVDNNNNGALDAGEQSTTTDSAGNYTLSNVQFGTFTLRALVPSGSLATAPTTAVRSITFSSSGQTVSGQDFGIVQVNVPSLPNLPDNLDTGASKTDNVTNLNALQFVVGNVVPGATVNLFDGASATPIATLVANSASATFNVTLAEGVHPIRAEQTLRGVDSGNTAATTVTVDTTVRVIDAIPDQASNVGELLSLDVQSTEEGQPGSVYSFLAHPAGMTLDASTGQISFTPTNQNVGHHTVTVQAVDLAGNIATRSFDVAVNGPPQLPAIADKVFTRGTTLTFTIDASDVNVLDFELLPVDNQPFPTGATITSLSDTTARFDWTPDAALASGTFQVTVRVSDPGGLDALQTFAIFVNAPPELATIADQTVDELAVLSFTAAATDQDAVTYSLVPVAGQTFPTGATIDAASGLFQWSPTEAQGPGVYDVAVVATDTHGLSDSRTLQITVAEVNQSPILAPIANRTVNQGDAINFAVVATDPDAPAQALLYSLGPNAPAGATIDPQSGAFSWPVSDAQSAGTFNVTIRVSDDGGQTIGASQSFDIEVNANTVGFALFRATPLNAAASSAGLFGAPLLARDAAFSATAPGPLFNGFTTYNGFQSFGDASSTTGRLPSGINNSILGADTGVPHALEELMAEMGADGGDVQQAGGKDDGKGDKGKVKPAVNFEPPANGSNHDDGKTKGAKGPAAKNGQAIRVGQRGTTLNQGGAGKSSGNQGQPSPAASSRTDRKGIWVPQIGFVQAGATRARLASEGSQRAQAAGSEGKSRETLSRRADSSGGAVLSRRPATGAQAASGSRPDRGDQIAKAVLFMPLVISQLPKADRAKRSLLPKQHPSRE